MNNEIRMSRNVLTACIASNMLFACAIVTAMKETGGFWAIIFFGGCLMGVVAVTSFEEPKQ